MLAHHSSTPPIRPPRCSLYAPPINASSTRPRVSRLQVDRLPSPHPRGARTRKTRAAGPVVFAPNWCARGLYRLSFPADDEWIIGPKTIVPSHQIIHQSRLPCVLGRSAGWFVSSLHPRPTFLIEPSHPIPFMRPAADETWSVRRLSKTSSLPLIYRHHQSGTITLVLPQSYEEPLFGATPKGQPALQVVCDSVASHPPTPPPPAFSLLHFPPAGIIRFGSVPLFLLLPLSARATVESVPALDFCFMPTFLSWMAGCRSQTC